MLYLMKGCNNYNLKNALKDIGFSKERIAGAIVILLVTSVAFYGFFYMSRESMRYFSVSDDYDIWILTDAQVNFYNTIYAAISIVMGLGSASSFLVDRPRYPKKAIRNRTMLLNDFRVLNWVFLVWIYEIGTAFGIFFVASLSFYDFSFYPDYNYMFILFVIVLYLQLWTNMRRVFTISVAKVFLPFTLLFLILSFLLGKVNFIDYKKLDKRTLSKNVYHKYKIEKPSAESWDYLNNKSMVRELHLAYKKSDSSSIMPDLVYDGRIINSDDLDSLIANWRKYYDQRQHHLFQLQLSIDKNIKMKHVDFLRNKIHETGIFRVGYSVVPKGDHGTQLRHKLKAIPDELTDFQVIDSLFPDALARYNVTKLDFDKGLFQLNDKSIEPTILIGEIRMIVEGDPNYVFVISNRESLRYGEFIEIYDAIRMSIEYLRDSYSLDCYGKKYEWNKRDIKREIREIYPMRIEDRFN